MKVKMAVTITGTRDGQDWPAAGGVVDLPDAEAAHMLASGLAVQVERAAKPEAASAVAPESAAMQTKPRRK